MTSVTALPRENFIQSCHIGNYVERLGTALMLTDSGTAWLPLRPAAILGYPLQTGTPAGDVGGFPDRFYIFTIAGVFLVCIAVALVVFYLFRNYGKSEE